MPAPDRDPNKQRFTTSIEIPKGLWGYYTDAEVDALLAALPAGGGAVDLTAYATTSYVDGQIETRYTKAEVDAAIAAAVAAIPPADLSNVYTKPEVDAAIANVATGGTVDLAGYATTAALDAAKAEIMTASTAAFQERYTKQEVDGLFVKQADLVAPPNLDGYATEQYVDDSIARIPATDLSGLAAEINNTLGLLGAFQSATDNNFSLLNTAAGNLHDKKADKATTYTKDEVDAAIAAAATGDVDLSAYAKLDDASQTIKAGQVEVVSGILFDGGNVGLAHTDTGEGHGERLVLAKRDGVDYVVMKSDLAPLDGLIPRVEALESATPPAAVDLSAYAKREDAEQLLLAKTVTAQAVGFGGSILPAIAITYTDTGEGYGERLVVTRGLVNDYLVYKSDLDELNALLPRVETLENRAAPASETVDLSPYALKTDMLGMATEASCAATYVTKSDARIYSTAADVAAFAQANYTPKADHTFLAETVQTIFTNTYTKAETDDLLKKYLTVTTFTTWGANFYTKQAADAKFQTIADMAIYSQAATVTAQFESFQRNILEPNYALKSEVPGAGVWKDLPLKAGFSTAAVGGRRAQYRIQFGYIELRGEVNRTGDYALDTEYLLATLPTADCPKEWVYGNGATYNGAATALPGVCHVGIKSNGDVIAVPLIRSCIRLYLDNVRVSTFR